MAAQRHPMIMVSPPTHSGASQHLRRPPAHRSVSLVHSSSTRTGSSDGSAPRQMTSDSPSSLRPQARGSSGESSNAENWFEHSNNDVQTTSASYVDHEPPFFIRNSSSSETPPDRQEQLKQFYGQQSSANSLPQRAGLLRVGTDGSSTEDYRSVIDDLTIKNKKLKRRLKKYEQLHDGHLKDDKLFEVRIHGLPAEKKRELEETLRKFTSSLGTNGDEKFPANGYEGVMPMLAKRHTTDSAYASMSASGQGGSSGQSDSRHKDVTPSFASKRQNVQSFLHQIPEGLMPQQDPATMTERSKKQLVVRKLEQMFAGRGAGAASHQHMQQQEEVSQIAARADRSAMEAQGQRTRQEGFREASIMRGDAEDSKQASPRAQVAEQDFAERSPVQSAMEQRPTRPLDLDPHRAQVPADNVRYIRHLGFSPLDPESSKSPEEGHGWVYLNLLISMAQLHTMNVTTDFVCTALNDYSEKFELSQDGRKVRWKGGRRVSRACSDDDEATAPIHEYAKGVPSARKRLKLSHTAGSSSNVQGRGGITQRSQAASNKYAYRPMFSRRDSTDDSNGSSSEYGAQTMSLSRSPSIGGDHIEKTASGIRASFAKNKRNNDGPIIFYNNATFFTDLSGERQPQGNLTAPPYRKLVAQPIGKPQIPHKEVYEKRGALAEAYDLPEPMDLGDNPIPQSSEIAFPVSSPSASELHVENAPIDFEVSGIGGVWPADNFAINVRTRHARTDQAAASLQWSSPAPVLLRPRLARILSTSGIKPKLRNAVVKQILTSERLNLPASALPPALSYMYSDEDSGDDSSDDEDTAVSLASPGVLRPYTAPRPLGVTFADSDEDDEEEEDEDDDSEAESDTSLDLLAVARELDPEAIRAREREYDLNMAERLAEEIPAGSSAATAGGGSGFGSPAAKSFGREEYRRAVNARAAQAVGPKETSTLNSMYVRDQASSLGSDDGSCDDEMSDIRS